MKYIGALSLLLLSSAYAFEEDFEEFEENDSFIAALAEDTAPKPPYGPPSGGPPIPRPPTGTLPPGAPGGGREVVGQVYAPEGTFGPPCMQIPMYSEQIARDIYIIKPQYVQLISPNISVGGVSERPSTNPEHYAAVGEPFAAANGFLALFAGSSGEVLVGAGIHNFVGDVVAYLQQPTTVTMVPLVPPACNQHPAQLECFTQPPAVPMAPATGQTIPWAGGTPTVPTIEERPQAAPAPSYRPTYSEALP